MKDFQALESSPGSGDGRGSLRVRAGDQKDDQQAFVARVIDDSMRGSWERDKVKTGSSG